MATIIKTETQAHPTGTPLRRVAYDLRDFSGQADDYLDRVRGEAAKIVLQAKQEAEKIRSQAEQAGRRAAEEAIEKILDDKVAQQMRTVTPALQNAVAQIVDSQADWQRHWEKSIVKLACAFAKRIVRRELQQQPEIALEWIREALQLASGAAEITLRLHPHDLVTLRSQVEQLAAVFSPAAPARIVGDETISLGGCRLETQFGSIDQQLETQLARISEELS
ncbi:MAG: FliH/SctL family protein [Bythopirellula sp.]|nr:FliH/SctL family protein [Bythopirellula sp.]